MMCQGNIVRLFMKIGFPIASIISINSLSCYEYYCFCMSQELYILQSDVTLISFSNLFLSVLHKRIMSFLPLEHHPKRNKMRTSHINKKLSGITWMKNGPQNMPTRSSYLSFYIVKLCLLTNKIKALHPQITRLGFQSTHF